MTNDIIFEPLKFRNLTVKNRIFRSNISGRFDNYDGSGNQARINWEEKFAKGGAGAIISSFVPVSIEGRIVPSYAMIDRDDRIPFWRAVGKKVHEYDCKFIMQLSHSGRQRDIGGIENPDVAWSSTDHTESFHGLLCRSISKDEIKTVVKKFADGARRAREAGLDGVELHGANGYMITQFLSSGINTRTDEYGGSLENRARFLLDIIRAVRQEVGNDFHFQVKISAVDYNNAVIPCEKPGNTLEESIKICQWIEEAGVDAIHVSTGSIFPHPLNPPGKFPLQGKYATDKAVNSYDTMLSSGNQTFRNFLLFKFPALQWIFEALWYRIPNQKLKEPNPFEGDIIKREDLDPDFLKFVSLEEISDLISKYQGISLDHAKAVKEKVNIPIISTGGYQQASYIRKAINDGYCDAVSMARMLVANNNLPELFAQGHDVPPKPCTYCNKCLLNTLENPLGCYEPARFNDDYAEMIKQVMSVFAVAPFQ
jgi:2,4-dienoyl-CoA reductase (NADPH2)